MRCAWATPLIVVAICASTFGESTRLDRILSGLRSPDEKTRAAAVKDLTEFEDADDSDLSTDDGIRALKAAGEKFAPIGDPKDRIDPGAGLIRLAGKHPQNEYIEIIDATFTNYTDDAREDALGLLAEMRDRKAAEAYVRLVKAHAPNLKWLPLGTLRQDPRHVDIYLDLAECLTERRLSFSIGSMLLAFCEGNAVSADQLKAAQSHVLRHYHVLRDLMSPRQQKQGIEWMWEDEYSEWSSEAGLFLDIMAYFSADVVRRALHEAVKLRDPLPKYWAIHSLLKQGEAVDPEDIAAVAASPERRCELLDALKKFKKEELFPPKFRTRESLAEGRMVHWLIYPTELMRPPDEIELMKVVTLKTKDGPVEYFVFRFRTTGKHWAAKHGWMAGIVGPFDPNEEPTMDNGEGTFSRFESWEKRTAEGHVKAEVSDEEENPKSDARGSDK